VCSQAKVKCNFMQKDAHKYQCSVTSVRNLHLEPQNNLMTYPVWLFAKWPQIILFYIFLQIQISLSKVHFRWHATAMQNNKIALNFNFGMTFETKLATVM